MKSILQPILAILAMISVTFIFIWCYLISKYSMVDGRLSVGMWVATNRILGKETNIAFCPRKIPFVDCQQAFESIRKFKFNLGSQKITKKPLTNYFLNLSAHKTETVKLYREANVAFVHLPKSGGTSVENYLFKHILNPINVGHCKGYQKAICETNIFHEKKYFFYSKRTYGLHDFLITGRPFLYFTWFRDPIDRIVSTYYFLNKTMPGGHEYAKKYIKNSQNLIDFLKATENIQYPDFNNFCIRLLQFGSDHTLDANFEDCCGFNSAVIPVVNRTHYLTAKKNLENMAFIGILDEWRLSRVMLDMVLGFKTDRKEIHVNANPHKMTLTEYERKEIERRNKWDILLYADALEIFARQKNAFLKYTNE